MVMKRGKQGEWPRERRTPIGDFVNPDGFQRSDRSVAGPLRFGTERRVGPRGNVVVGETSDYGKDHVSPRGMDPIGTSDLRGPAQPESTLLARQIRRRDNAQD